MKKITIIHANGKRDSQAKRIYDQILSKNGYDCTQIEPHDISIFMPTDGKIDLSLGRQCDIPDILYSYYVKKGKSMAQVRFMSLVAMVVVHQNIVYLPQNMSEQKNYETKPFQMFIFKQSGLPILDSFVCLPKFIQKEDNIEYLEKCISYPIVIKGDGDNGVAVWKAQNREELRDIVDKNHSKISILLLQKYLRVDQDIKVVATQHKVIASLERRSDDFLKNISTGGSGHKIELTDYEKEISTQVVRCLNKESSGLDLLRGGGGVYLSEANKYFNVKVVEEISQNSNVMEDIVDSVLDNLA
jgi:RimK-like ATP-grasp domain